MRGQIKHTNAKAKKRARRVRIKLRGTVQRPRLSVHFSNRHLYAQCIDDDQGRVIAVLSDSVLNKKAKHITAETTKEMGKKFAEMAKEKGVEAVIFDRGSRLYHGRVKAFADGAREGGLKF